MTDRAHIGTTFTGDGRCNGVECWCNPGPVMFSISQIAATPEAVGAEIRRLLLALRATGHTGEEERVGHLHHGTDAMRAEALDRAGICWKAPGELAPACTCPRKYVAKPPEAQP